MGVEKQRKRKGESARQEEYEGECARVHARARAREIDLFVHGCVIVFCGVFISNDGLSTSQSVLASLGVNVYTCVNK